MPAIQSMSFGSIISIVAAICSVISMLGNIIGVAIMLYVRSEVKPIGVEIRMLAKNDERLEKNQVAIWQELGSVGQRISHIEGASHCPATTGGSGGCSGQGRASHLSQSADNNS